VADGWTFIAPIDNLVLSDIHVHQFKIGRVLFASKESLPFIRKKIGLPVPISQLKYKDKVAPDFLRMAEAYAIVRGSGEPSKMRRETFIEVQHALSILSLSLLGYSKRRFHSIPTLMGFADFGRFNYMIINRANPAHLPGWQIVGTVQPLRFDGRWYGFARNVFYLQLINILNGKHKMASSWKHDIQRAAVLAGQSQESKDLKTAFLYNMIVLEVLLTKQGDKYIEELPARIESFLGWVGYWRTDDYENRIRELYRKRCALVHDGKYDEITIPDLLFSDDLLLNVFNNLVNHIDLFPDKDSILSFAEKVECAKKLGVKSKVQPKTLRAIRSNYSKEDYDTLW
jgi:hypothetical protein